MRCFTCQKELDVTAPFIYNNSQLFCNESCFVYQGKSQLPDVIAVRKMFFDYTQLHPIFSNYNISGIFENIGKYCYFCKLSIMFDKNPLILVTPYNEGDNGEISVKFKIKCKYCYKGIKNEKYIDRHKNTFTTNKYLKLSPISHQKPIEGRSLDTYLPLWYKYHKLDLDQRCGGTDYIDFVTVGDMDNKPIRVGVDCFKRKFISIMYREKKSRNKSVVTLFQRYTDNTERWADGLCYSKTFAIIHNSSSHIYPCDYEEFLDFIETGENEIYELYPTPYRSQMEVNMLILNCALLRSNKVRANYIIDNLSPNPFVKTKMLLDL